MGKNDLDGQLNLFGNDPYQPKKAKASEEQVELSTEAEEFLSVGRRKKKTPPQAEEPKSEEKKADQPQAEEPKSAEKKADQPQPEEPKPEKPKTEKPKTKNRAQADAVVMQQSFSNASGKSVTVAYVDYNCVYVEEPEGKATLTQYPDAKTAVDHYLSHVARLSKLDGFKKSKDHPALRRVECQYAE